MPKLEEITAVFTGERHRFENPDGDVIIGDARLPDDGRIIAVKGQADIDELSNDLSYRFYGHWTSYRNKRTGLEEQQFAFQTFVKNQPYDRAGVIAYLCEAGAGNGLGRARAAILWDAFQSDAVRIAREQPETVATTLKAKNLPLTEEQSLAIASTLEMEKGIEACKLELTTLLAGRGFPKTTIREAVREWGNKAATIIRRDPYTLMQFRGCGFKRADAMYLDLKLPAAKLKRQMLSAWYSIARNTEGHTWFPLELALAGIRQNISGAKLDLPKAMRLAKRSKALSFLRTDHRGDLITAGGSIWCAEGRKARNENRLAEYIAEAMAEEANWPVDISQAGKLTDHQRERAETSLSGVISLLGGSPGTGKTFTAAELIGLIVRELGSEHIGVAAPTGKAAVRVTEALNSYGLSLRARTIHSLLGVQSNDKRGGWGFEHDESNPLPFKFLIIDESSMIDTDLCTSLLAARAKGTHVLFVGDVNQLPPVGHGAPLRDMILAGLPYGELREIRRNSGTIVEACAAIRDGQPFKPVANVDIEAGKNFAVLEISNPEMQIEKMIAAIRRSREMGFDPVWDVQVLVPVNAKSPLARKRLNEILQRELNNNPGIQGSPFRLGDKIVNTKNDWFRPYQTTGPSAPPGDDDWEEGEEPEELQQNDRGEIYVANGELAEVVLVEEKLIVAKLSNPSRVVAVPRGKKSEDEPEGEEEAGTGCTWDLAYALSVHKSQGSEFPVAIVMVDDYAGAKMVCSREWIYTAISRAKKLCLAIGKQSTAQGFCRKVALGKRKTFLKELIVQQRERVAAEKQQEVAVEV